MGIAEKELEGFINSSQRTSFTPAIHDRLAPVYERAFQTAQGLTIEDPRYLLALHDFDHAFRVTFFASHLISQTHLTPEEKEQALQEAAGGMILHDIGMAANGRLSHAAQVSNVIREQFPNFDQISNAERIEHVALMHNGEGYNEIMNYQSHPFSEAVRIVQDHMSPAAMAGHAADKIDIGPQRVNWERATQEVLTLGTLEGNYSNSYEHTVANMFFGLKKYGLDEAGDFILELQFNSHMCLPDGKVFVPTELANEDGEIDFGKARKHLGLIMGGRIQNIHVMTTALYNNDRFKLRIVSPEEDILTEIDLDQFNHDSFFKVWNQ